MLEGCGFYSLYCRRNLNPAHGYAGPPISPAAWDQRRRVNKVVTASLARLRPIHLPLADALLLHLHRPCDNFDVRASVPTMRELRSASHGRRPFLQLSRLYKRLAAGLVVLALFGLLRSHASTSSEVAQFELVEDKRTDRISLIMVWAGLEVPRYLRPFLRSVEANRAHVDLLLIAKRQDD